MELQTEPGEPRRPPDEFGDETGEARGGVKSPVWDPQGERRTPPWGVGWDL